MPGKEKVPELVCQREALPSGVIGLFDQNERFVPIALQPEDETVAAAGDRVVFDVGKTPR